MKKIMNKISRQVTRTYIKVCIKLKDTSGGDYVDTGIKILIAVVLGALLLGGLYALFNETILPTLKQRVQDMFNYSS